MLDFFLELDRSLFLILNGIHSGFADQLMFYISYKYTWVPFYAILLGLIVWRYQWKTLWLVIFIVVLITLSDQLSVYLKNFFERLRPCHETDLAGLVHQVQGRCGGTYGFVSSHAANSFSLAMFIGLLLRHHFRYILSGLLIWAAVVSYSRVYLGVHYPGDILFGALLGIAIGVFVFFLWKKWIQYTRKPEKVLDNQ